MPMNIFGQKKTEIETGLILAWFVLPLLVLRPRVGFRVVKKVL